MNLRQFRWLISQMRCASCGKQLEAEHVQVLGQQENLWFLSVFCEACQTQGLVAALVREVAREDMAEVSAEPEEPVTADNVLDMHNFFKTFDSDFHSLFAREKGKGA